MSEIIDNRDDKLVDAIRDKLKATNTAHFATGYFYVSGLESVSDSLSQLENMRLLIGTSSSTSTVEQMAEGYRRLEEAEEQVERQTYQGRSEAEAAAREAAESVRATMELMEPTDEGEDLVKLLVRLIEEGRLHVRVYTKGVLHAKAYIFDYAPLYDQYGNQVLEGDKGSAIVGSSNFTLSGVTHNTELNVIVTGNENHAGLKDWFEGLWEEAQDFDESLMQEMKQSWAVAKPSPYDVYMKILYTLVQDRLEGAAEAEILPAEAITDRLTDFQRAAYRQAVQIVREYGGAFVADVVGLGKSFIGAAIVKHFEQAERARPLIICPKPLVEMWERYNELYELNARVLSMSELREGAGGMRNVLTEDYRYRERDFVLVDESHNFRNRDTQRYHLLQEFLAEGRRCCFLTATPRNKTVWDIYHQIKLFHPSETTVLPVDPPHLGNYFRLVEGGERELPSLLSNILIRRTRNHIIRWYGYDAESDERLDPARFEEYIKGERDAYIHVDGQRQFFPRRRLETVQYSIEEAYAGLYQRIRGYLGKAKRSQGAPAEPDQLTYARYGLGNYVLPGKREESRYAELQRAGSNLRGLIRVLLFKRFESSVHAFRETVRRLLARHRTFLDALDQGVVPAGEEAEKIINQADGDEDASLVDALREVSASYDAADFDVPLLRSHVQQDLGILEEILGLVEEITAGGDAKLQTLKDKLSEESLRRGKRLIFTQYADTAQYLYDNLDPGESPNSLEVIYSGEKSKHRVVGRFAPRANPQYQFAAGEAELDTLVATDVLAEGLNMQDCDKIINYDLHWNPVKLIQRFGRIDRIGSEHGEIYGYNFLPETLLEEQLGLQETLSQRIGEIQETIGEDAAILDPTEKLNTDAMYAIYTGEGPALAEYEEERQDPIDLDAATEMFRQMREDDPGEYERIASLRDGVRGARSSEEKGSLVFCKAGRYQQLYLLDGEGNLRSRNLTEVLRAIECEPGEQGEELPRGHNEAVRKVKEKFGYELRQRRAEQEQAAAPTQAQRYVSKELQVLFGSVQDRELREKINALEQVFGGPVTEALRRELNSIHRQRLLGEELVKALEEVYSRHGTVQVTAQSATHSEEGASPVVVCSAALV